MHPCLFTSTEVIGKIWSDASLRTAWRLCTKPATSSSSSVTIWHRKSSWTTSSVKSKLPFPPSSNGPLKEAASQSTLLYHRTRRVTFQYHWIEFQEIRFWNSSSLETKLEHPQKNLWRSLKHIYQFFKVD